MPKLFISADMEGCAAVASPQALLPDRWSWEWTAARRWMTAEVSAAAEAAFASGYDEVVVADSHGNAHNIDPENLPENVRLVRSWPRPLLQMQGVDLPEIEACAFIGYHAGAGTADSILSHSFSGLAFRSIHLNGEPCSEGYLNAALAGEFGKPVVFVSADSKTLEDARRYAPGAVLFSSKQSVGWRSQASLPPSQVCRLLKEAISRALSRSMPTPFVIQKPFHLELEMISPVAAEMLAYLPGVERSGAFRISAVFQNLAAVVRFIGFAMLYTPSGAPPF